MFVASQDALEVMLFTDSLTHSLTQSVTRSPIELSWTAKKMAESSLDMVGFRILEGARGF